MAAIEENAPRRPGISFGDVTDALKRRFWILAVTTVIGTATATGVAYILPPLYEAEARILVESQQIPEGLARSTVTASAAERLQVIKQRLTTRENLLDLIQRLNLYNDKPNMSAGQKVGLLRSSTRITPLQVGGSRRSDPRLSAFTISFTADSAAITARVTNELVTMVLEQNLRTRSERASETHDFFREEVERLTSELLAVESEITSFKNENSLSLPGGLESRQRALTDARARQFERSQRRIVLEDQLQDFEAALERGPTEEQMTFEERELRKLEREVIRTRALLSENHPRVRALQGQVDELEKAVAQQNGMEDLDLDQLQKLREEKLRRRIELVQNEIAQNEKQTAEATGQIEELAAALERAPQVEMALIALDRRHDDLRRQYNAAVQKQTAAATGEKLEVNRQAERFEVIEQAEVPGAPVSPKRAMIAAGGLAGSVALGLVLVALVEFLNTAVRTPADIERRFGLRPIATVPYIHTMPEVQGLRRRALVKWLLILVVIPGALFAIDRFYLPLAVLGDKFLDKTGLESIVEMIKARL